MWPETAHKHQNEMNDKHKVHKETKANPPQCKQPKEQHIKQMVGLKTLMEMVLGDAGRGGSTEHRVSSFHKSSICDVIKIGQVKERLLTTDEDVLLAGLQKEDEIYLCATFAYIQNWCGKVDNGISTSLGEMYVEFEKHGEEAYAKTRIKGAERKILSYIKTALVAEDGKWNLHIVANSESIGALKDVEGKVKGSHVVVENKGWGAP